MQFSRIKLENWRNFGKVDVPVATRVFLVGANASGKSNFLDALRFLHELVIPGGFEKAVKDRGGVSSIRNLAARRVTRITLDVELSEGEQRMWRYRLVFNQDNRSRPFLIEEKVWESSGELLLNRSYADDKEDIALFRQTHLEQASTNRKFQEIVGFFRSIKHSHIVPQLVRNQENTAVIDDDPFGSDLLDRIATTNKKTSAARLRRIQKALKAVAPKFSEIELIRDERGIPHLRGKYEHWRKQGAWQRETEFSDGTLRLIGMLWALQDGEGPLLLEEPEQSLHSEVVGLLPQMIYKLQRTRRRAFRQVFISTHSPELLQDEGIGAHEVFFLSPSKEGATIRVGFEDEGIREMLREGISMSDIVMSRTRPEGVLQLLWDL